MKRKAKRIRSKRANRPAFREGSVRQRVWSALGRKLAGGGRVKLADVAKACRSACKMGEDAARSNAGLLVWTYVRAGLIEKVARGEFALARKREG